MNTVSISRLWGKAWNLFKLNWLLLVGLFILGIIVSFIPIAGVLIYGIIMVPALSLAGFLVARQEKASFEEVFRSFETLLKIFLYDLILQIVPAIMIAIGYVLLMSDAEGIVLIIVGLILVLILSFFGWAGPYAIIAGRAGVLGAIGHSFSLTGQNFGTVLLAWLSLIGLTILGLIPCGLGLLVVIPMMYVFWPLLYLGLTEGHSPTPPHTL